MVNEKKPNTFEEYKYAALVGMGSLVILLILIFAVGMPLYKEYQKSSATLKEKKTELARLEVKLANLKEHKKNEVKIKEDNKKVMDALPTDKDVARLFVQFENIATQNGVLISSVTESSGQESTAASGESVSAIKAVSYNVEAKSIDYQSLKNALAQLEKALRILNVSAIDASSTDIGPVLNTKLTVSTYLRSE
jgi:Tfp pilus assembly protein PilO